MKLKTAPIENKRSVKKKRLSRELKLAPTLWAALTTAREYDAAEYSTSPSPNLSEIHLGSFEEIRAKAHQELRILKANFMSEPEDRLATLEDRRRVWLLPTSSGFPRKRAGSICSQTLKQRHR